jgi:hypothetical protein
MQKKQKQTLKGFEEALEKRIASRLARTRIVMRPLELGDAVGIVRDELVCWGLAQSVVDGTFASRVVLLHGWVFCGSCTVSL